MTCRSVARIIADCDLNFRFVTNILLLNNNINQISADIKKELSKY